MASPHLGREVQALRPAGHHRGLGPPFSDAPPPCERCLEVAVCLEGCRKVGKGGMRKWKPEKALAAESLGAPSLQKVLQQGRSLRVPSPSWSRVPSWRPPLRLRAGGRGQQPG